DAVNAALRRRLLRGGTALIGRTDLAGAHDDGTGTVRLKLTLLNPQATTTDIDELLAAIAAAGQAVEAASLVTPGTTTRARPCWTWPPSASARSTSPWPRSPTRCPASPSPPTTGGPPTT